jgi:hypothetical protein
VRWTDKINGRDVDPEAALKGYREHRSFCMEYFASREEDLLQISVKDPDAYQRLASFSWEECTGRAVPLRKQDLGAQIFVAPI